MAGFDTTPIAASVGQGVAAPANPMAMMGQFAQIQNARNANTAFQAKALAGQYLDQATGPDGQPDPRTLNNFLMSDPRTAAYAPEIMSTAFAQQGAGLANQSAQTSRQAAYRDNLQRVLATTPSSKNPDPAAASAENARNLTQAVAQGASSNLYPADFATSFLGGNPTSDGSTLGDGIAKMSAAKEAAVIAGAGGPLAAEADHGAVQVINDGANQTPVAINRFTGTSTPVGAPMPNKLSPSEEASGVAVVNPTTGQTTRQPLSAFVDDQGNSKGPAPVVGAPFGTEAAAAAAGVGSANQLTAAHQQVAGSAGRILALKTALNGLQTSGTGPGSAEINNGKSFLQSIAPGIAKTLGVDPTAVANYDEINKNMIRYGSGMADSIGHGTDASLAAAVSGNPNAHISTLANQDILKVNMGLERYNQAMVSSFDASGQPPGSFGSYQAHFAQQNDPRAFMLDLLPKADRQKLLSTITTPAAKRALLNGKQAAESSGLFSESDIPK